MYWFGIELFRMATFVLELLEAIYLYWYGIELFRIMSFAP